MSWVKNSRPPSTHRKKTGWDRGLCWGGGYRDQGGFPPNLFPFEPDLVPNARWSWPQDGYPRGNASARGSGLPWRPKPQPDLRPFPNFPFAPDFARHPRWEYRHRQIEVSARGSGLPWYPKPRIVTRNLRLPTFPTAAFRGPERVRSVMEGGPVDDPPPHFEGIMRTTVPRRPYVWRYDYCRKANC